MESPMSQPLEGGTYPGGLMAFRGWPPQKKQVVTRYFLLACSYLAFGLAVGLMFWRHGYTSTSSVYTTSGGASSVTYTGQSGQSVFQVNRGPVTVILILLAGALLVSTLSLIRRIARRSNKIGVPGVVAASVVGAIGVLGLMTVGPFILPLAALLLILAIPMDTFSP